MVLKQTKILITAGILSLMVFAVFLFFLIKTYYFSNYFPSLEIGSYHAKIIINESANKTSEISSFWDKDMRSSKLYVAFDDPQLKPFIANMPENENLAPLVINTNSVVAVIKLIGKKLDFNNYSGEVLNEADQKIGIWKAEKLAPPLNRMSNEEFDKLKKILIIKAELNNIDAKIASSEMTVNQQKEEIAQLESFITEGKSLKNKADNKYVQAKDELSALSDELEKKKQEARALGDKFEISNRVTNMGRLVSLSRETLERENRWFESMLKFSKPDSIPARESLNSKKTR